MKKLLVALILSVILSMTFATPAFAGDGNGNMPGKAGDLENPQGWVCGLLNSLYHLAWGPWMASMMSGGANTIPVAYGWYAKAHSYYHIINGQPPAKPHWAGGP